MIVSTDVNRLGSSRNPVSLANYGRVTLPPYGATNTVLRQWLVAMHGPEGLARASDGVALGTLQGHQRLLNDPRAGLATRRFIGAAF